MKVLRTSRFTLKFSNSQKKIQLREFLHDYTQVMNQFISLLWCNRTGSPFVSKKELDKVETSLSARAKQAAAQQALHVTKTQRKKNCKTMPIVRSSNAMLGQRFIRFIDLDNSYDEFVRFGSLGNRIIIVCPIKHHKHYNKLINKGFVRKNAARLLEINGNLYIDIFLEKEIIPKKSKKTLGIDLGIKKLIADSDGNTHGKDIESIIDKINRKKHRSRGFYRALSERNNCINQTVNTLPKCNYVLEDLKGLHQNTKKRIRKSFRSKIHRWTYAEVIKRIKLRAEVVGVQCQLVNPAYTSQTCFKCGDVHKSNRNGELFLCRKCGYTSDADVNASKNILNLGLAQESLVPESSLTTC